MKAPQPLNPTPMAEVPLPRAPLVCALARVDFPPILAIRDPDKVAKFQEKVFKDYPNLSQDPSDIELAEGQPSNVSQSFIWRFSDQIEGTRWQVSLGVGFVALRAFRYDSREDFLDRLQATVSIVEQIFKPALASRLGLRYINQLTGEAVERVGEFFRPEILGISCPSDSVAALESSIVHTMTNALFLAPNDAHLQGHWGQLPPNATPNIGLLEPIDAPTWVLDLDISKRESRPFVSEELLTTAKDFAQSLYWFFRQMVTEEFLKFYGGKP